MFVTDVPLSVTVAVREPAYAVTNRSAMAQCTSARATFGRGQSSSLPERSCCRSISFVPGRQSDRSRCRPGLPCMRTSHSASSRSEGARVQGKTGIPNPLRWSGHRRRVPRRCSGECHHPRNRCRRNGWQTLRPCCRDRGRNRHDSVAIVQQDFDPGPVRRIARMVGQFAVRNSAARRLR